LQGAFTNLGGGQDLRAGLAKVSLQIAARLSIEKKSPFVSSCQDARTGRQLPARLRTSGRSGSSVDLSRMLRYAR